MDFGMPASANEDWDSSCAAVAAGDLAAGRRLHDELFDLNGSVFFDTNPIAIKCMMTRLGILAANEHRLPMMPTAAKLEERLGGVPRRAGLLRDEAAR